MARKSDGIEALRERVAELEHENAFLRAKDKTGKQATPIKDDQSSDAGGLESARMRALLRSATDYAIIETDAEGRITFWNAGAATLLGWTEEEAIGQNVSLIFIPEDRRSGAPEEERREALAVGISDTQRWHLRKDGSKFYAHERVTTSSGGKPRRFLKILRNRTKERADEEARLAGEEQMRLILDSAVDYAIFTVDRDGLVTTWNPGAERLLGYQDSEILGQHVRIVFTPQDRETGEPEKEIAKALSDGRAENERWHVRKDSTQFWGSGLMLPLRAEGTPGFLKIMRDQTQRHRAEELNKTLIDELNHRVKNTLALVKVVVRETLKDSVTETEILAQLDARLAALASSHDILARKSWESADLTEVIRESLRPFVPEADFETRIEIRGKDVRLNSSLAVSLGMAFHELATNAAKYGALSVSDGLIDITWHERASSLALTWQERNGPPVLLPQRKGFGSRLIERALTFQTGGSAQLFYQADGLRFDLTIPAAALER